MADQASADGLPPLEFKHHHTAISVSSLDEAIAWYSRALGFELEFIFPIEHINARAALIKRGPLRIEIFEVQNANPLPPDRRIPDEDPKTHGNKHPAYAIRSVAETLPALVARGVDIAEVINIDVGSAIYIRDPFGNLIEFVQAPDMWA
jgi:catechol 2,3-dioxygenase-like lactoylglutathione lyase family enzyme